MHLFKHLILIPSFTSKVNILRLRSALQNLEFFGKIIHLTKISLSVKMVTRTRIELMSPPWKGDVLTAWPTGLIYKELNNFNNYLVLLVSYPRLERGTTWLKVKCSTTWANSPYALYPQCSYILLFFFTFVNRFSYFFQIFFTFLFIKLF